MKAGSPYPEHSEVSPSGEGSKVFFESPLTSEEQAPGHTAALLQPSGPCKRNRRSQKTWSQSQVKLTFPGATGSKGGTGPTTTAATTTQRIGEEQSKPGDHNQTKHPNRHRQTTNSQPRLAPHRPTPRDLMFSRNTQTSELSPKCAQTTTTLPSEAID